MITAGVLVTSLLLGGCTSEAARVTTPKTETSEVSKTSTSIDSFSKKEYFMSTPIGKTIPANVSRVIDGDTVEVKFKNGKKETVRLLLIDTPETKHPTLPVQPFGKEASAFAKKFFPVGAKVEVDIDVSERDKYGRLLAYLWKDGVMYQDAVLDAGLARVAYVYAPNTSYVDALRKTMDRAKQAKKGIWSVEDYATDRGFVTGKKSSPKAPAPKASANTTKGCSIKGNIGSGGKIYHVVGGRYYNITKAEKYFCSEKDALAAGFRKSSQ